MTIVVSVLLVTAVWIFLAAVLGGCSARHSEAGRDTGNVFGGEFWLWERRDGGVRLRAEAGRAGGADAGGRGRPAVPSPTA